MPRQRPTISSANSAVLDGSTCATDAALSSAGPDSASHERILPSFDTRSTTPTTGDQMPRQRPTISSANSAVLDGSTFSTDAAVSSAEPDSASHGRIPHSPEAMGLTSRPTTPITTDQMSQSETNSGPLGEPSPLRDTALPGSAPDPASHRRTRKRQRNPSKWKHNQRQKLTQAGKEYVSARNKTVPAKSIKDVKACETKCKFNCKRKISEMEREGLHENFKSLDFVKKHSFILGTTECHDKASQKESRRVKSYTYTFVVQGHKIRVCKSYYLGTLSISQKMIYGAHGKKSAVTGTPKSDGRGKHAKKTIPDEDKDRVISHINSFLRVESHYCRATTNKEYLETGLNLKKMYDLYKEKCEEEGLSPVKLSCYRNIFNYSFNLESHHRKTDRCDLCEKIKVAKDQGLLTEADEKEHSDHILNKEAMRKASEDDKQDDSIDVLVSFDLQNVISLPRADISSFFYKRKLNVYNLTGHLMDHRKSSKEGYCVVWPKNLSGRAGNDLASAFIRMLEKITDERSDIRRITTWSDSCVPQSRNKIISYAIYRFLHLHPHIDSITMKFSVPGHSCVQSVDNMHSQIEKTLMANEVVSPVSLMWVLKKVNKKKPFYYYPDEGTRFQRLQIFIRFFSI